jgi:hypothetical protein
MERWVLASEVAEHLLNSLRKNLHRNKPEESAWTSSQMPP